MSKKNVDDYLQEGMYGKREIKPEERKRFLGTIRERILLAISYTEVMKNKGHHHLEQLMRANPSSKLLLNGTISYELIKDYKLLAEKNKINYTFVTMKKTDTDMGVILTYDHAVDKKDIFLSEIEKEEEPISIPKGKQSKISSFIESFINDMKK